MHEEVACGGGGGGRMVWSVHTENLETETSTNTNLTHLRVGPYACEIWLLI